VSKKIHGWREKSVFIVVFRTEKGRKKPEQPAQIRTIARGFVFSMTENRG
jgi:hypothetical protein